MKIYFANALFSHADFNYNAQLAAQIRRALPDVDMYVPQENAAINNKEAYADSKMIAEADTKRLLSADLMIAILDGPVIENGVASEIGDAYDAKILMLGHYTESRRRDAGNKQKHKDTQQEQENKCH